uniref:Complement 4B (Chido blood group) n=1 Tax=Anabas testudineus TaxID=64144 RepID=A0A7N6AWB9_ANATE
MKLHIFSILLLIFTVESQCSTDDSFFISAPSVFHVGVNEKVFVQLGKRHLHNRVSLHLEHETTNTIVSQKKTTLCTEESETKTVELMIDREIMSRIRGRYPDYLLLVAESPSMSGRKLTRVLISKHRGYIFIQTNQPMYNPTQKVQYRIFTLDHTLRPHEEVFQLSVFNAAGNRIMKSTKTAKGGIFRGWLDIPDVAKTGTWRITAHYEGDEAKAATREFKVQKFVLPSFEVNIAMEHNYILLSAEEFVFTISAIYSRGDKVKGAYHCQFGMVNKEKTLKGLIKGLELTGSIVSGSATVSLRTSKINEQLKNQSLSDLQQSGARLYLRVFVTNIQSGEISQAEVYLPVISHKYTMDLSRTRSYFVRGYPVDVVVVMRLPDGSPAAGVPLKVDVKESTEKSWQGLTDQDGTAVPVFNIQSVPQITVKVTADGVQQSKIIKSISSSSGSHLYMSITNKVYSVNDLLSITFNTINGPGAGFIYYMVLSRGILVKHSHLTFGTSVKHNLQITSNMVPSFRVIGYFYNQRGDVIADSLWVDVRDECEIKVKVAHKGEFEPGNQAKLEFDLNGQTASVALLAVDKAFYALKADNKLTANQVFSTMQSYDLGCSYGGGADSASVLTDAGLSFVSQTNSASRRKSNFSDETLQECCAHGFSLLPMRLTCEKRAKRVAVMKNQACADAFLKCCLEGEDLRKNKTQADAQKGFGRTASVADIEEFFFDTAQQYIRRYFPPSFSFSEFEVNDKKSYALTLPDSITTWEIQVITLSRDSGFCVAHVPDVKAVKRTFVSLRLPYSVKKYEQLSISPVIYNYGDSILEVAVHMEQTEGLCSPGSATTTAFVNITVEGLSSQFVTFSAVPMKSGSIPIKIRLYDIENERGIDAIEKTLNVRTEGIEQREEVTSLIKLDGKSTKTFPIDGILPENTVPDSDTNIFISMEGNGVGNSFVRNLLAPEKIAKLIVLPTGCVEQTMVGLAPTVFAVRYLDLNEQWFDLRAGTRDDALDKIERGFTRIFELKKDNGSYGPWYTALPSNWLTAYVLKVLAMVAERQKVSFGAQGRKAVILPEEQISHTVSYLLSVQNTHGSFTDQFPVLHRGVLVNRDRNAFITAFTALALKRSLQFLQPELHSKTETSISRSTTYLQSQLPELQHPYAVAVVAYCLSICMPKETDHSDTWRRLKAFATEGMCDQNKNDCYLWTSDPRKNREKADAITVETSAYALLTAIALKKVEHAKQTACWLTTQENFFGGFKSSQDTIMALQALSEYELFVATSPETNIIAQFTSPGKKDTASLALENKKQKVEIDLKKLAGNQISVLLTGNGEAKLKVMKAYYLLDAKDTCQQLSINVTVEGKVKYITITETYEYYDDYDNTEDKKSLSAIEQSDARTRTRRDLDNELNSHDVTYTVCVSHSLNYKLTGMAIADITLLSGFEAVIEDLDVLKEPPEEYISHYEVSYGRVLIYFNDLLEPHECISFDAVQRVPIGLLQPAPAVFYDYYEPGMGFVLWSPNCVQRMCARPCHKQKLTFKPKIMKNDRVEHACFFPTVDYAYMVEVISVSTKSNFELYETKVTDVLRSHGDVRVRENSVRVFAKRRQCKEDLELGKHYLIMGKDGSTTDSSGEMQYLLESNTWVEKKPSNEICKKSAFRSTCAQFSQFTHEYKVDGCRQ